MIPVLMFLVNVHIWVHVSARSRAIAITIAMIKTTNQLTRYQCSIIASGECLHPHAHHTQNLLI